VSLLEAFSVEPTFVSGRIVLTVRGTLHGGSNPLLRGTLARYADHPGVRCVEVNIDGLTFIDSEAIDTLVGALERLRRRGVELVLSGVTPEAYRVLEVCGMMSVFALADEQSDAGEQDLR
jgi:anti-anti-sigma factor